MPPIPAAMWCDAIPPGLNGSKPSAPQAGVIGCTLPVSPYGSDTQIPGPKRPVTWKAPKPKHNKPERNRWIPKILGKSRAGLPVLGSRNNSRSQ